MNLLLFILFAAPLRALAEDRAVLSEIHPSLDIDSLDPVWANDNLSRSVIFNIYEPLVALKGDSVTELEPRLADKVPSAANGLITEGGKVFSFPIRKGVRFQDGSTLTCEDARYSILRFLLLDRTAGGPSFQLLKPLAGVLRTRDENGKVQVDFKDISRRVICDGSSLRIRLPRPYSPLLQILAQYGLVVSKRWAVSRGGWDGSEETWARFNDPKKEDSPFFDQANGTGPYALERWDKALRTVVLAANTGYWRQPAPIQRVVLKEVPENPVRRMMLNAGDADILVEPAADFEPERDNREGIKPVFFSSMRTDAFFFTFAINPEANPAIFSGRLDGEGIPPDFFTDKDVRKAFAYAFDYDGYLEGALGGKALAAAGFIPPELLAPQADDPRFSRDLAKVKDHFERAWNGTAWRNGFRLAVYYNTGDKPRQSACEMLKRNIEAINPRFKVEVRSLNWASYLAGIRDKKFPLFLIGYAATYADPDCFATAFLHSQGLYMRLQGLTDRKWDKLVGEAAYEGDPKVRAALYRRLEREAFEEARQIYLSHPLSVKVFRDDVSARALNPLHPGTYFYDVEKRPVLTASRPPSR